MPRLLVALGVLLSSLILWSAPALAQSAETPPPVWSGRTEFSFVSAAGNSSARTYGASGELDYHPDGWLVVTKGSFVQSTTDEVVSAQSFSAESRVSHRISPRVDGYGQIDFLTNRFAGIDSRLAADGGLAWDLIPQDGDDGQSLQLIGGLGYSHENNLTDGTSSFATGNTGLRYNWQMSKTASVSEDGLFTGSLDSGPDWRVRNTIAVTAALNSILSLKLSHRLDFVNQPVPGFRKADQLTSAAIVASF